MAVTAEGLFVSVGNFDITPVAAAIDLLRKNSVDLVLLDVRLPGQDGIETLKQIKALERNLLVIMMTAYPTVSSLKQAFSKGAMRYLTKPVDLQELTEALRLLV